MYKKTDLKFIKILLLFLGIDAGISEYDIDPKRMGLCLIINNDVFTPVSERSKKELRGPRRGSDLDASKCKYCHLCHTMCTMSCFLAA